MYLFLLYFLLFTVTFSFQCPSSKEEWKEVAQQFQNRWQFINCGGALDGKHIRIVRPPHSGAMYYNYKGFYSIVLMALVNADYKFMWLDIGKQGRISDGGVLEWTEFFSDLNTGKLHFPPKDENHTNLDFVLIGDEAFALHKHLLKPYSKNELTHEKRIFNYRLARARNVVENAFGLLSSRFRILHSAISITNVDSINYIVAAACVLHNYLLTVSPSYGAHSKNWKVEDGECSKNDYNRVEFVQLENNKTKNPKAEAKLNRDKYCEFFNTAGTVEWQEEMLRQGKA